MVALGALELLDDLPTLSDEAPRFLSAGEQERAEAELVAQPPGSDQIPIRDQTPERSERKEAGPARDRPAGLCRRGLEPSWPCSWSRPRRHRGGLGPLRDGPVDAAVAIREGGQ